MTIITHFVFVLLIKNTGVYKQFLLLKNTGVYKQFLLKQDVNR